MHLQLEDDILFVDVCDKFIDAKKANDSDNASIVSYRFAVDQFVSITQAASTESPRVH